MNSDQGSLAASQMPPPRPIKLASATFAIVPPLLLCGIYRLGNVTATQDMKDRTRLLRSPIHTLELIVYGFMPRSPKWLSSGQSPVCRRYGTLVLGMRMQPQTVFFHLQSLSMGISSACNLMVNEC